MLRILKSNKIDHTFKSWTSKVIKMLFYFTEKGQLKDLKKLRKEYSFKSFVLQYL